MIILIVLAIFLAFMSCFLIGGLMGAPWVPTLKKDVNQILRDGNLKANQIYIELGCGDGRLVSAAAKKGAESIGYEINPLMWFIAYFRNIRNGNAHIRLSNFWHKDLSQADLVMTFLMPRFMKQLETKLNIELKSGAKLISYVFKLPNKKPALKRKSWQIYNF